MGLLNWLFGGKPRPPSAPDSIWLTQDAKYRGMVRLAAEAVNKGRAVCVVAPFTETLEELKSAADWPSEARFMLAAEMDPLSGGPLGSSGELEVMVAERHFCCSEDEDLIVFCQGLPANCRIRFHLSLEDPLFQQLAGGAVGEMLSSLGMGPEEAIESSMVSRRITAAQQQFCPDEARTMRAASASEWLHLNGHG